VVVGLVGAGDGEEANVLREKIAERQKQRKRQHEWESQLEWERWWYSLIWVREGRKKLGARRPTRDHFFNFNPYFVHGSFHEKSRNNNYGAIKFMRIWEKLLAFQME
jgi:hypothetical protein